MEWIIDHKFTLAITYMIICFWTWALCKVASDADDEADKMFRVWRVK